MGTMTGEWDERQAFYLVLEEFDSLLPYFFSPSKNYTMENIETVRQALEAAQRELSVQEQHMKGYTRDVSHYHATKQRVAFWEKKLHGMQTTASCS